MSQKNIIIGLIENSIEDFKIKFYNKEQLDKSYEIDCKMFSILNLNQF